MVEITVQIDGKDMVFEANVNMRASLEAFTLLRKIDETGGVYTDELIEEGLQFACDMFGNRFTRQQLLDGCMESFFVTVPRLLREVVSAIRDAIDAHPNLGATQTTGAV